MPTAPADLFKSLLTPEAIEGAFHPDFSETFARCYQYVSLLRPDPNEPDPNEPDPNEIEYENQGDDLYNGYI